MWARHKLEIFKNDLNLLRNKSRPAASIQPRRQSQLTMLLTINYCRSLKRNRGLCLAFQLSLKQIFRLIRLT